MNSFLLAIIHIPLPPHFIDFPKYIQKILVLNYFSDKSTISWIVSAITKIVGRLGYLPDNTRQVIEKQIQQSNDVELNQVIKN